MQNTSNEKISEALHLLDEAAREKKDEFKSALSDKYAHLKDAISAAGKHAVETAVHVKDVGAEKAREVARDVDKNVHQNPWPYIAGTAAVGLLLGYILGRNRK